MVRPIRFNHCFLSFIVMWFASLLKSCAGWHHNPLYTHTVYGLFTLDRCRHLKAIVIVYPFFILQNKEESISKNVWVFFFKFFFFLHTMKVDCLDQNKNILQDNWLVDNLFIICVFSHNLFASDAEIKHTMFWEVERSWMFNEVTFETVLIWFHEPVLLWTTCENVNLLSWLM